MRDFRTGIAMGLISLAILVQGCASTGGTQNQGSKVYDEGFKTMVNVVKQAIKGQSLTIEHIDESDDGNTFTIYFGRRASFNDQNMQQEQAIVTIEKIEENKTRVEIENPDYHYSVPEEQRVEYRRILTNRIEDILNG